MTGAPPAALGRLRGWALWWKSLRLGLHVLVGLVVLAALPLCGRRAGRLGGWWYRRLLRILGVVVQREGSAPAGACLAVANHVSWLDIIVLGAQLDAVFVSKAEIGAWPLVGGFARHTGTVFLPRGAGRTQEATAGLTRALASGRVVVLFPEATTNAALAPKRFHARLFAAAIEAGVPVQPLALHYLPETFAARSHSYNTSAPAPAHHPLAPWVGEAAIRPHFKRLFRLRRLVVKLHVCPPIAPADYSRDALAQASHAAICAALQVGSVQPATGSPDLSRLRRD